MRTKITVSAVLMVVLAAVSAVAQTPPRLVRYTDVVRDAQGAPRTGAVTLTFALYVDAEGGAPLWTEAQAVTLGADGRYSTVVGATRPEGLPLDLFASSEARWLGVQVEGQVDGPRVMLVSVPYALKAADTETVSGKPLSAFVLAGDATGVGPDGLTYVDTRVLKQGLSGAGPLPQGVGTPGYLGVFVDANFMGNSVVFQNGTSIGVGTTAPAAAFHSVATAAPGAFFDVYSNALGALPVVFRAARGTPASPTAVQTDDILGGLAVRGYGATTFSAGRGQVMFKAAENWTDDGNGTYLQFTTTPIGSATWAERMRIDPSGKVGIGTTTPAQALSVAGTIESTSGGFKFPDGTIQASAAVGGTFVDVTANQSISGTKTFTSPIVGSVTGNAGSVTNGVYTTGSYADPAWITGLDGRKITTPGLKNTAVGVQSLYANTTGDSNTASGYYALRANTTGSGNTASGFYTLQANTIGNFNTASGYGALSSNTTGYWNTASGFGALQSNTTGYFNTASGTGALNVNTTGYDNTANGYGALWAVTTGYRNTASGSSALFYSTTGAYNIAIGYNAGQNLTTGNYNIDIGHSGVAAEANTIRIGTSGDQTRTFVAGIRGVTTGSANAVAVLIDSNGQLGTVSSSRRVKDDIADMAEASRGLMKLRPVTFHYKSDQNPSRRTLQYGLIAEEVAEVYPGLVARSADGQIETVMYQFLPPMLLNEYQKQQRTIDAQAAALARQTARFEATAGAMKAENDQKAEQIRTLVDRVLALETRQTELLAALVRLEKRQ